MIETKKVPRALQLGRLLISEFGQTITHGGNHAIRVLPKEDWVSIPSQLELQVTLRGRLVSLGVRKRLSPVAVQGNPNLAVQDVGRRGLELTVTGDGLAVGTQYIMRDNVGLSRRVTAQRAATAASRSVNTRTVTHVDKGQGLIKGQPITNAITKLQKASLSIADVVISNRSIKPAFPKETISISGSTGLIR